ncbi:MAG TPA: EI24 domain-containing protein [Labilithrix sp.]|nr:EI24 domain-containing protein [Labilithrix sp.]
MTPAREPVRNAKRLGFFDGITSLFGGIGFIVGRPAMWGWALIPAVVATVMFVGFVALLVWGAGDLPSRVVPNPDQGPWAGPLFIALRVALWIVSVVVAYLVALALAQPLSGFALDAIARKQELSLGGRAWPDQPFFATLGRSLRVTLTALAVTIPTLALLALITFLFPPAGAVTVPLKFLVTGLGVAYDFLDYPLGLRGIGVRARLGFIRRNFFAVLGFGAAAAMLLLLPGVGLLLLPFGVAGATRMVMKADAVRG